MRRVLRDNPCRSPCWPVPDLPGGPGPAGYRANNNDNEEHHQPPESYAAYLTSEAFAEATFENWESEFLQMGAYVLLTAWLLQKAPRSPRSRTATRSTGPPRAARRPTGARPSTARRAGNRGGMWGRIRAGSVQLGRPERFPTKLGRRRCGHKQKQAPRQEGGAARTRCLARRRRLCWYRGWCHGRPGRACGESRVDNEAAQVGLDRRPGRCASVPGSVGAEPRGVAGVADGVDELLEISKPGPSATSHDHRSGNSSVWN
jgi:hypothetical protein